MAPLVLTLHALFIAVGAPLAGQIIDRFGRRRLLLTAILVYSPAGGSGRVAVSLPLLLVGRALLGLAIGAVSTCTTTLISDYYTGQTRSRMIGFQSPLSG